MVDDGWVVMQRNGSEWLKPLSVKRLKPEIPLACITTGSWND
jgi:hypothetical protein